VCRLDDDEFIVLHSDVERPCSAARLSRRIVDAIRMPFDVRNYTISTGASIGVAMIPQDGVTPDDSSPRPETTCSGLGPKWRRL